MGFILFLLFTILIFKYLGGFARIAIFSILTLLLVIALVVHLWWLVFLIIPFVLFTRNKRQREYVKTTRKDNNIVDGEYEEVDDK
ncbi:hypothetical protein RD055328_05610 [Companilactobacillus sp. RD055328]|uniref:hypothetical protein n=1 Tax=Companilactobacillus sp. RD055328 TaxID=2916634 RepID=UPI001FC843BD|nr:hypothetical protein [Companilactobacillus sp. RD055328]GKQ42638.1 hypothetical protein RD055328_05610 [Companilactobacillus sp. RD055328]